MRFILAAVLFCAAACTSSSKTEEFCTRADSCNRLIGSVDECVEELDTLLDQLPPSQRDELLYSVQQCLDRPSCDGFGSCIQDLRTAGDEGPQLRQLEPIAR